MTCSSAQRVRSILERSELGDESGEHAEVNGDENPSDEETAHAEADCVMRDIRSSHQPDDDGDIVGEEQKHQANSGDVVRHGAKKR